MVIARAKKTAAAKKPCRPATKAAAKKPVKAGEACGDGDLPRRPEPARPRPLPQPRADLARLQQPRAARGGGRAHAAARAREVPRDHRREPRRVLHEAHRRAQAAGRGRRAEDHRRRPHARPPDPGLPPGRPRPARAHGAAGRAPREAAAGREDRTGALRPAREGGAGPGPRRVRALDLPAGHAPVGRPRAPLPLRLEPLAQPAGDAALPRGRRALAGARQGPRRRRRAPLPARRRQGALRAPRGGALPQPRPALPRHGDRALRALPRDPQRERREERGGRRRPARADRVRAAGAPVRPDRAPRGDPGHGPGCTAAG